jgi:ATP-dependent exoDNAse (exonuclease V) beta subunit
VLRLPEAPPLPILAGDADPAHSAGVGLTPAERGTIVHALLEQLDFRRPVMPSAERIATLTGYEPSAEEAAGIVGLLEGFAASESCARLAAAASVRREERFAFLLGDVLVNGVIDALARDPGDRMLVVDYKSDRLEGRDPGASLTSAYTVQRLIYALAALRAGAAAVEVRHLFLERPQEPVAAAFTRDDVPELERQLNGVARGVLARDFGVTDTPHRALCGGCPGEGGLCSWPAEMTRREAVDRLF